MNRRRFLVILSTATAGLWLGEKGLLAIPRQLILQLSGSCSFCGKHVQEVYGLAGIARRPVRICDECISLCLDIIDEEAHPERMKERDAPRNQATQDELDAMLERFLPMQWTPDELNELILKELAAQPLEPPPAQRGSGGGRRDRGTLDLACSFCDLTQKEVAKLIAGPTVYICDSCIAGGASLFVGAGWARGSLARAR